MPIFPIFDLQQFLSEKLNRSVKNESVFECFTNNVPEIATVAVLLLNFKQFFEALRLLKKHDLEKKKYFVNLT